MKGFFLALCLIMFSAAPAWAGPTNIVILNKTPKEPVAKAVVEKLTAIIKKEADFALSKDKFEPSVQVIISSEPAYLDIHSLSVVFTVFNESCSCYYTSSLATTKVALAANQATDIFLKIKNNIKDLTILMGKPAN